MQRVNTEVSHASPRIAKNIERLQNSTRYLGEIFDAEKDIAEIHRAVYSEDKRPRIKIYISNKRVYALLDTGASISVIPRKLADKILPTYSKVHAANGTAISLLGISLVKIHYKGKTTTHYFRVVENLPIHEAIIGVDLIEKLQIDLNKCFYGKNS